MKKIVEWDNATGLSDGIDLSVAATTLTNPEFVGPHSATILATKGSMFVIKTININFNTKITVNFMDDSTPVKKLAEDITFTQEAGTTIDLSKQKNVQDTLKELKERYTLTPLVSEIIKFEEEYTIVEYKFTGKLFIESFPSRLNFKETTTLGKKFIEVKQPKYDAPLVIGDTRNGKTPWELTVTLEKPLTSEESPSEVLKRALWHKKSDSTKEMLYEKEALPIEVGTVSETGAYNISNNWDNKISGLEVNVYASEIIEKGDYKATILWQVGTTP